MEWLTVGFVKQPHGLKGELFVHLFSLKADWLKKLQETPHVKLVKDQQELDFELKQIRPHKTGLIIWPKKDMTFEETKSYRKFLFQIPQSFLVSEKGEAPYLSEFLDFEVYWCEEEGSKSEKIGRVKEFSTNKAQDILVLDTGEKKHGIPFVQEFIISVDYKLKKVFMSFPKELLDYEF